jgi:hypothetical protein
VRVRVRRGQRSGETRARNEQGRAGQVLERARVSSKEGTDPHHGRLIQMPTLRPHHNLADRVEGPAKSLLLMRRTARTAPGDEGGTRERSPSSISVNASVLKLARCCCRPVISQCYRPARTCPPPPAPLAAGVWAEALQSSWSKPLVIWTSLRPALDSGQNRVCRHTKHQTGVLILAGTAPLGMAAVSTSGILIQLIPRGVCAHHWSRHRRPDRAILRHVTTETLLSLLSLRYRIIAKIGRRRFICHPILQVLV